MTTANITKIELDANLLRAATPFSGKNDIRYYLNGIHLDPKGYINATNGHILFRDRCPEAKALSEEMIISIKGTIPASATNATITLIEGEKTGLIEFWRLGSRTDSRQYRAVEFINGDFPDTARILPQGDPIPTPYIGINPAYMALVDKAQIALGSRYSSCIFKFRGKHTAIEVSLKTGLYEATVVIMPMSIKEDEEPKQAA